MPQTHYEISFDLGAKLQITQAVNKQVFPMLNQAVRAIAAATAKDWRLAVYAAKLWSVEKDAYAQSIKWKMTGDFSAFVQSDYKHAKEIETGRSSRDLKKMLDTSTKVRRTEDGRRFLVIPFEHKTPGAIKGMPGQVYNLAKAMDPSSITSSWRKRRTGEVTVLSPTTGMHQAAKQSAFLSRTDTQQAATTTRLTYAWGGRLTAGALKNAGADAEMTRRYAGMVKMNTSTPGGAKSSKYLTFRIMMEGSKGWIVQPKPGLFLLKNTVQAMQPKATAAFAQAIARQLAKAAP